MKKVLRILLIVLLVIILLAVVLAALIYFDVISMPEFLLNKNDVDTEISVDSDYKGDPDDYKVEATDAEAYFKQNGTIEDSYDVNDSADTLSEKQVYELLTERGFTTYSIVTEYAMDGTYNGSCEISSDSTDHHPIYLTYYMSSTNEMWQLSVVDGNILASPISYNLTLDADDVQKMVSESKTITSYDSTTNKIFKTIPNSDVLEVYVVSRIDAATLDGLTTSVLK